MTVQPESTLLAAAGLSAASTLALAPLVVRVLASRDVLDDPNHRSSHVRPVVRGAGLVMAPTAAVACVLLEPSTWPLVVVAAALAGVGFADDLRPRRAAVRFAFQAAAGAGLGLWVLESRSAVVALLAVAFCCGYVNATNFMDGINGITGLHALVGGVSFGYLGWDHGLPELAAAGGALAGAGLGFLPVNFPTAKAFPGDAGSYLVGGWVAGLVALGLYQGLGLFAVGGAAVIYVADTGWAVIRRALHGEPLTEPHRQHVYQRLVDGGHSHAAVSITVAAFSIATAAIGIASEGAAEWVAVLPLFAALYLALPYIDAHRPTRVRTAGAE